MLESCYAMYALGLCSALLRGAKGKRRDAMSVQQVKEWPNYQCPSDCCTVWPGCLGMAGQKRKIWRRTERGGGDETRRDERHAQVKCTCAGTVTGGFSMARYDGWYCALVWFGLVWFWLWSLKDLAAVRRTAVRVCSCMRRREMRQVGVLFQVELPA